MPSRARIVGFRIALIAIVAAALELMSLGGIAIAPRVAGITIMRTARMEADHAAQVARFLEESRGPAPPRIEIDSVLGWRYRAGFHRGGDVMSTQGLRSLRTYAPHPPAGVLRVAAFGDSFTYGNEVETAAAWTSVIEAEHPDMEVLNYGVGGYGVDQALLRWELEGRAYDPHVVVMGFTPDDLRRLVNVYRPFIDPTEFPLAKPRFILSPDGAMRMLPTPLRDTADLAALGRDPRRAALLGEHDQWFAGWRYRNPLYDASATVRLALSLSRHVRNRHFDPQRLLDGDAFNPRSEAFRLQVALFESFAASVRQSGRVPVVAILPDMHSVGRRIEGRRTVFDPLLDTLRRRRADVVDLSAAFAAAGGARDVARWFAPGGHYSPAGNVVVARALAKELRQRAAPRAAPGVTPGVTP